MNNSKRHGFPIKTDGGNVIMFIGETDTMVDMQESAELQMASNREVRQAIFANMPNFIQIGE